MDWKKMLIKKPEYREYPFCDTDIWVNIILGEIEEKLFEKYDKIMVADVVEWEILKFGKNEYFKKIADRFVFRRDNGDIIVIHHHKIEEQDRRLLEKQLLDCAYRFTYGLSVEPHEKHKGEIVSAIYAQYYEAPFLKSGDGTFNEGEIGRKDFPDLIVKGKMETLQDLLIDRNKVRDCNRKIKEAREFMNIGQDLYKKEKAAEEEKKLDEKIDNLLAKFSHHKK